ncbi:hypothetical protein Geu3261_0514_004 [Komagataeibacter europaeus NBRC 3261]|uniref:Phage protein n=1 Tax=Komagataeibacter europaeus NBRC 3261 TaxID=1234669 RepID=A0A0D6Q5A4_KOMEU|nr:hypothetical protein [Komagataeibacter europaeus]GAN98155.1 hypothetical protein Geu3261_0514_004 [Komagataeibacter europaeus NBRC 3261]
MTIPAPQNYILYRTTALTRQPESYTDADGKTITPSPMVISPAGTVVGMQLLTTTAGIAVPDGFAFALDAAGTYPVGSIYTPPAATAAT